MGVSGSGKSTVGRALAAELGFEFADADDFHSAAAVAAMASGSPLRDEDRWPWLELVRAWLLEHAKRRQNAVIACSALRRAYRDVLRVPEADVWFCHLRLPAAVIRDRLDERAGHFMSAGLLPSQLAVLEPLSPDEPGVEVDADGEVGATVAAAIAALSLRPPPAPRA